MMGRAWRSRAPCDYRVVQVVLGSPHHLTALASIVRPARAFRYGLREGDPVYDLPDGRSVTAREGACMFRSIVIDCQDLERQATVLAAVGGFEQRWTDGTYLLLIDPAQPRPTILLQRVPEGKQGKNRLHID